ncbi:MAG TPA: pitrilysin family protein [Bryobacteraceae bacterium]|nr:pitrilysin family protein [Bryobacteraceae bacterium]
MSRLIQICLLILVVPFLAMAQDLKEFEKHVTEFTLANGLHFIVLERHEAPVVSFHTYVNAGSVDDPEGKTGLAHMFEHMAFKGTDTIGTKNWSEEKKAMEAIETAYDRLEQERRKGRRADPKLIQTLQAAVKAAIEKSASYVIPNLYPTIIEENGGVGLNASTSLDSTEYFYNLPANRVELWFLLESQRFLHPVYRDFYKERDVVMEERRMRVESDPQGKLMETMLASAFEAHPYRRMPGGWATDIQSLRVRDAEQFYKTYYVPSNITIGVVGDVDPKQTRALAERYFGRLPAGPLPPLVHTVEPLQEGPRLTQVESPAQPFELIAYKRPDQYDKDDPVFDVISGILAGGRTGLIYKEMVRDKQISLAAGAEPNFPGSKYPSLFMFYVFPALGHNIQDNEKTLIELIERFKKQNVDAESLARVKTKTRATLIRQLDSNSGLAQLLTSYYVGYGDWRKLFTSIDDIEKVTADDVQRVAQKYFVTNARTTAFDFQPPQPAEPAGEKK